MFQELGLTHTYLDENKPIIPYRARFYELDKDHKLKNVPAVDNSMKWAGGGFLSTVGDLLQFGNAMLYSYQYHDQAECSIKVDKDVKDVVFNPSVFSPINQELNDAR